MGFMDIAESLLLYVMVGAGILFIIGFALLILKKSWAHAYELGYTKKQLMSVVKSSISSSIVPSIAIIIGFFGLAAMLGIPWPWWRLSVIGSVTYEIMAADMAMTAAGVDLATASGTDFTLIMYVMSICILGGLVGCIFISKKIQTGAMKIKERDQRWGALANSTFMLTMMIVLMIPMLLSGGVTLLTFLTSAGLCIILGVIIKKCKLFWLNNFVLAICLIGAMVSSVLWTNLLG